MIDIKYDTQYGDSTCKYIVSFTEGMTVGEFISEWLTHEQEWGYFGIENPANYSIFGDPRCEYSHGIIKGKPLPKKYLKLRIKDVRGSGGWSRSDFIFLVER